MAIWIDITIGPSKHVSVVDRGGGGGWRGWSDGSLIMAQAATEGVPYASWDYGVESDAIRHLIIASPTAALPHTLTRVALAHYHLPEAERDRARSCPSSVPDRRS
jgi:hypothetical protein